MFIPKIKPIQHLMLSSRTSSHIFRCVLGGNPFVVSSSNRSFIKYLRNFSFKKPIGGASLHERCRLEVQLQNPRTPAIKASPSQKVHLFSAFLFGVTDRKVFISQLISRVGYRNPVPIRHRYSSNQYVPNQNADFGASFLCHAWAIGWNICPLVLRNRSKKHHHQHRTWNIISRLRKCTWTQFGEH